MNDQTNFPQSMQPYRNSLPSFFQLPQTHSQRYKEKIMEIFQSLDGIDSFTTRLQEKVDILLKVQENQFVTSYKTHMQKLKEEFSILDKKVTDQQNQIKYYENQGKMSQLVQKVHLLQQQSKKLYGVIEKKDKTIKDLHLQNKVQIEENKRIFAQMKQMMKNRINGNIEKRQQSQQKKQNSQEKPKFFTTQIKQEKSLKKELSQTTDENKIGFTSNLSEKSAQFLSNPTRKLNNLKMKNKKLMQFTSKLFEEKNDLETIFINCVEEIKKQIKIRRKMKECSFQQFKKQDKLNILINFISNEDVLQYIHQRMFQKRKPYLHAEEDVGNKTQFPKARSKNYKHQSSILPYLVPTKL